MRNKQPCFVCSNGRCGVQAQRGKKQIFSRPNGSDVELFSTDNSTQAVWFPFGDELGRWVQLIRAHDQNSGNNQKTLVSVQMSSLKAALNTIHEWKEGIAGF
jgi:hypothetical protein